MKTHLVRIGNSRGVRILIEEAGLSDDVELRAREGAIIISRTTHRRAGWKEAAATTS
jgi:antitoxin component of MazEF toxin-antitoxin module